MDSIVIGIMVRDEEDVITKTLQPFATFGFKNYLIYDTGSIDKTVEISRSFINDNNLTGAKILQEDWIDYSRSRNKLLEHANDLFPDKKFLFMIDAEWYCKNLEVLVNFCTDHVNDDIATNSGYHVTVKLNTEFKRKLLTRIHGIVKYCGDIHEYVECSGTQVVPDDFKCIVLPSKKGSQKSSKRWRENDLPKLLNSYQNGKDPRHCFYLAQTYECLGEIDNAIKYYSERITLTGFLEEKFIAAYRIGNIYNNLRNFEEAKKYYLTAYNLRRTRIEPLIKLANIESNTFLKYLIAKHACSIPYPENDLLFVEKRMYDFNRWDILSFTAWEHGEFEEAFNAVLLALSVSPLDQRIQNNLKFILKMKGNANMGDIYFYENLMNTILNKTHPSLVVSLPKKENNKILNLILLSDNQIYLNMAELLSKYLALKNVDHYFYCFKEDDDNFYDGKEYKIVGDVFYLKGKETLQPGILDKTLKALDFFKDYDYDYIVRSNVSTIVDFDVLDYHLSLKSVDYGGFYAYKGVDGPYCPNDLIKEKYENVLYYEGSCVILSKRAVFAILEKQVLLREENQMDDVSFGVVFENTEYVRKLYFSSVKNGEFKHDLNPFFSHICYRNKRPDRTEDLKYMKIILNQLISLLDIPALRYEIKLDIIKEINTRRDILSSDEIIDLSEKIDSLEYMVKTENSNDDATFSVFAVTWNEERLLPFFLNHYKQATKIYILDNESTDNSRSICQEFENVEFLTHSSGGEFDNGVNRNLKNNFWKTKQKTDYFIVQDLDEFLFFPEFPNDLIKGLTKMKKQGVSIIKSKGLQMYCSDDEFDNVQKDQNLTTSIINGSFEHDKKMYNKVLCFNPNIVKNINYDHGSHNAYPKSFFDDELKYDDVSTLLLHYKYLGKQYIIDRHLQYKTRESKLDIKNGFGFQYFLDQQKLIGDIYDKYASDDVFRSIFIDDLISSIKFNNKRCIIDKFTNDDFIGKCISSGDIFNPKTSLYIKQKCGAEKITYISVGLNVGYRICIAKLSNADEIFGFEYNPDVYEKNKSTVLLNGWNNVKLFNFGLSDSEENVDFKQIYDNHNISQIVEEDIETYGTEKKAPFKKLITLKKYDSLDISLENPIILQIDSRGNELSVLKGMDNLLKNESLENIIIQLNPKVNEIFEIFEIISLIESYGFNKCELLFNNKLDSWCSEELNSFDFTQISFDELRQMITDMSVLEVSFSRQINDVVEVFDLVETPKIGFVFTRHVNSKETNRYWNECYRCIRNLYPTNSIIIVDDNSIQNLIVCEQEMTNCSVIQSQFKGCGELLAYYYMYSFANFEIGVVLHDSVFIKSQIDYLTSEDEIKNVKFLWEFNKGVYSDSTRELSLISKLNPLFVDDLSKFYKTGKWNGCFGVQSVITKSFLSHIQEKYQLFNLIHHVNTRNLRMGVERIFGLICCYELQQINQSLLGNILTYVRWGFTYEQYLAELRMDLPLIKVWTGR
jgi:FkbM family methyltransferase